MPKGKKEAIEMAEHMPAQIEKKDKKIIVTVHDSRQGHDGNANGGLFGWVSNLLVKVKPEFKLEEAVNVICDENSGKVRIGRLIETNINRYTKVVIDPTKVKWACVQNYRHCNLSSGSPRDTTEYTTLDGVPGGPLVEKTNFLEKYPAWAQENVDPAKEWLLRAADILKIDIQDDFDYAERKSAKNTIDSAWKCMAERFEVEVSWPYSWNGVRTAPLKIALAVQKKYKFRGNDAFRWRGARPVFPKEEPGEYAIYPKEGYISPNKN